MTFHHDTGGLKRMLAFVYWKLPEVLPMDPHGMAVEYSPELAEWTPIRENQ